MIMAYNNWAGVIRLWSSIPGERCVMGGHSVLFPLFANLGGMEALSSVLTFSNLSGIH